MPERTVNLFCMPSTTHQPKWRAAALALSLATLYPAAATFADSVPDTVQNGVSHIFGGVNADAANAIVITNYVPKLPPDKNGPAETARREAAYKAYFNTKYGYNPTPDQIHDWYVKSYGIEPA
jgi:hypothetical protein